MTRPFARKALLLALVVSVTACTDTADESDVNNLGSLPFRVETSPANGFLSHNS